MKFEGEGQDFAKFLRSLEQFTQPVKGQTKIVTKCFFNLFLEVSQIEYIRPIKIQIRKNLMRFKNMQERLEKKCFYKSHGAKLSNRDFKKSINLQYIMLGCLDDGTNKSSAKSLMLQVFKVANRMQMNRASKNRDSCGVFLYFL